MVWGMSILRGKGYEENDSVGAQGKCRNKNNKRKEA